MIDINAVIESLDWSREPKGLYEPIGYALSSGGKRLRPQLALLACRLFGGDETKALPVALALEVFHNFTLLHDDVMDRAAVRRGRPTVHVQWNDNTAILSGDQMLIEAYRLLSEVEANQLPNLLCWFNEMATGICEGQQYDVDFEQRDDVTIEEYIQMIRLKTSVLLANALRSGAYIAGADPQQQQCLYDWGIHVGLAFQIQDDMLDVYGDPNTFGKAIGGDICCNKKTYLLLTALQRAQGEDKKALMKWLGQLASQDKIQAVTALYDKLGVRAVAEQAIRSHSEQAMALMANLPHNEAADQLNQLVKKLQNRNS